MAERSWWGWGEEDRHLAGHALAGFAAEVGRRFGVALDVREPVGWQDLDLPAPRVAVPGALGPVVSRAPRERAVHAHGQSFRDVVRAFDGELDAFPDAVAFPRDEPEVAAVLDWCADAGATVVPFGGGTSVVGGVTPPTGERPVVTLSLARHAGVAEVDDVSQAARVLAGTAGPRIEDELRAHGLTLRFYPQSWEFSTLGGWVATRAAGHFATGETRIDHLVEAVTALTPSGRWASRRLPGSGAGPSPDALLLGSEGTLGVVTDAWVRVRPRPTFRADATVAFPDLASGCAAVRALVQARLAPANCRLLDEEEAALTGAGDGSAALLVLGFESSDHPVREPLHRALELTADHGGSCREGPSFREGDRSGEAGGSAGTWREAFLRAPYLRDALVAAGCVVETFETAVTWDRLDALVDEVRTATRAAAAEVCGTASVSVRLTHAYPDGAAPYVTVVAPGDGGSRVAQWDAIKAAASETILGAGGTITHHHAVGRDHRPWYDRQRPEPFAAALRAAKDALDPAGVLNPGVLLG